MVAPINYLLFSYLQFTIYLLFPDIYYFLQGRWTSLDKNFTINEDGSIESNIQAESKPYTAWTICNARLILNTDTFDVLSLGADSLELESAKGIFVYKRQNTNDK